MKPLTIFEFDKLIQTTGDGAHSVPPKVFA